MKTLLSSIIVSAMIISVMLSNSLVFASCAVNEDWPDAPCFDVLPVNREEYRVAWAQYYDYKGSELMDLKKIEMFDAKDNGRLSEWMDMDIANHNVFSYYQSRGEISFPPEYDRPFFEDDFRYYLQFTQVWLFFVAVAIVLGLAASAVFIVKKKKKMKKIFVIIPIIAVLIVSIITVSLLYNQEIKLGLGMMRSDEKPEPAYIPDPICFVVDKATLGEKESAEASEVCFPLSNFESLGCDRPILEYIYRYTNLLDKKEPLVYLRNTVGLPEGITEKEYEKCADVIYVKRATVSESNKPTNGSTIVYPAFENGVTEIVNPEHEPLKYHATTPIIDDTYLSKNVRQWTNTWPHELDAEYQKYGDEFYTELGRLLMKNEMQYQMNNLGIENAEDDFEVISGVSLDSLPPHIGFSTIIHATDGHYYWLQGSTLANKVSYYKTTQLQYPNQITAKSVTKPNEIPPRISIQMKGDNDLKSVPPFVVLYSPGEVEFYNETPETLFVFIDNDGLSEFGSEQTQEIWTRSDSGATWPFSEPGAYSWRGKVQATIDNKEYELNTGGGVLVLSDDLNNLSKTEQMETARMILITSGLPIVGIGQKGEDDTLYISLDYAIEELLPESRQYYLQRAQQLIPFDITIKLDR